MFAGRSWDDWIAEYAQSHRHPVNRLCHSFGIPMIAASIPLFLLALWFDGFWIWPTLLFVIGWILQFIGHVFEGKPPEFFKDWHFLFVGLRWWWAKMRGRA
ncbi:Mpo1-like protein [Chitinolyticbacter meiyuanensis]|uniref:Mpo1-like protein n=1 Tax=Chitinolyticbacter meiyuanensis TaxID=682798 RepID=UPI0011E5C5E6|nr:DUF962 domain-containing protein [Chitinolyticbacter meiyuanensis]